VPRARELLELDQEQREAVEPPPSTEPETHGQSRSPLHTFLLPRSARAQTRYSSPVLIRPETPDDWRSVGAVAEMTFGRRLEVRMIESIRASDGYVPELSLVAEDDETGALVGHVMLSYVELERTGRRVLELGPLAVRPSRQRQGIGSRLVREALARADALGEPLVVVLGHPEYYPRFGFRPSSELGIERPHREIPPDAFMVVPLSSYDPALRGRVVFPPGFV
jgi:putative acetyltransferase